MESCLLLYALLVLLLVFAIGCMYLRRKAVRWLFTTLSVLFWIAFLLALGFVIGYDVGQSGLHLAKILF